MISIWMRWFNITKRIKGTKGSRFHQSITYMIPILRILYLKPILFIPINLPIRSINFGNWANFLWFGKRRFFWFHKNRFF